MHSIKGDRVEEAALTRNTFTTSIIIVVVIVLTIFFAMIRDKMLAYSTYRNQWTSSGEKKLVVDASKVAKNVNLLLVLVVISN